MEEWQRRVEKAIPVTEEQSKLALYNSLPDYLENLALLLETFDDVANEKENLIGKVHGQHRANTNYSIIQMVEEYFILKDVVILFLKKNDVLTIELFEKVGTSFQKTLQYAVSQFANSLLDTQENFVLNLAHDLRSPLMIIKLQSEMMIKKATFNENSCQKVINTVDKVDGMIEHLLDTIRSNSAATGHLDTEDFNLCNLVSAVVEEYEPIYPGIINIEKESTIVNWNKHGMERVLDNLISNALKYGDITKPITIKIKSDEHNVYFSIHNYGPEIPPKDQLTLFEKFKRADAAEAKGKKGWGIGLNYVKTTVEKHKGIVLVHSDQSGTTFKFEAPRDIQR